jgi:AcrR family transcriptional regulator
MRSALALTSPGVVPTTDGLGRRRAIIDAALAVFNEKGYARASIDDIRRLSGASTGSIYHHFGAKEAIAAAVFLDGLERWQGALLESLDWGVSAAEGLAAFIDAHFAWVSENTELARYLMVREEPEVALASRAVAQQLNFAFGAQLDKWLRAKKQAGQVRDEPSRVLFAAAMGPCRELTGEAVERGGKLPRRYLAGLHCVIADALGVRPARAASKARRPRPSHH